MTNNKRKHHIVPATYLSGFTDENDKLYEYRKDSPKEPNYNVPREVGHRRDYYAQPTPEGGTDYNALEDFFDKEIESKWQDILFKIKNKKHLLDSELISLIQFITMLRVRVPATRDAVEQSLATHVKATAKRMNSLGMFPPIPPELAKYDILNNMVVAIDPHMSIHAMVSLMKGLGQLIDSIGFKIYKNQTPNAFLTSDNPVIYFDPDNFKKNPTPYEINPSKPKIELIFPLDSKHILHGHSDYKTPLASSELVYETTQNGDLINRFNDIISMFGYEKIFTPNKSHEDLIVKRSRFSPVFDENNHKIIFGTRSKLPKWKNN